MGEADRGHVGETPRITAGMFDCHTNFSMKRDLCLAKTIINSIEFFCGEEEKAAVFCFCTRSKEELSTLTSSLSL